ncbi:MAG: helix-turn-helix transcriptional regulator [Planctomycetes bacterium]|nr:helix-turn-helix transcriptional regulator [Planctomycetota bacterium]
MRIHTERCLRPVGTQEERRKILRRIGENVRRERLRRGLSQERLGFEAGLHRNYIGFAERAERSITVVNIVRIAKALRVPIQGLFRGAV